MRQSSGLSKVTTDFVRAVHVSPPSARRLSPIWREGQQPYATILGCSDSRVPPELIFDADFGELFIIRVAGNVISPEVMGSMQYAGAHLHTPLFVVLGHEGCGAVKAAVDSKLDAMEHRSRIQNTCEQYSSKPSRIRSAGYATGAPCTSRRSQR
jgi:carbonic anhydrase